MRVTSGFHTQYTHMHAHSHTFKSVHVCMHACTHTYTPASVLQGHISVQHLVSSITIKDQLSPFGIINLNPFFCHIR